MLLKEFIAEGVASLRDLYPEAEARSIVLMLCEALLGVQRYTHLIEPQTEVPAAKEQALSEALERLKYYGPSYQICIKRQELLDQSLTFLGSEEA